MNLVARFQRGNPRGFREINPARALCHEIGPSGTSSDVVHYLEEAAVWTFRNGPSESKTTDVETEMHLRLSESGTALRTKAVVPVLVCQRRVRRAASHDQVTDAHVGARAPPRSPAARRPGTYIRDSRQIHDVVRPVALDDEHDSCGLDVVPAELRAHRQALAGAREGLPKEAAARLVQQGVDADVDPCAKAWARHAAQRRDALCFMVMEPSLLQRLALGGWWRLAAVGGWQLVVGGGWRLAVGRLAPGGSWRLAVGFPWDCPKGLCFTKKKHLGS